MTTITIKDRKFAPYLTEAEILGDIEQVASRLTADYEGKDPLFLVVLNGAFMFATELLKALKFDVQVSFVKLSSYQGTQSSGAVKKPIGLSEDVNGRHIVVVEDIVDTGTTMRSFTSELKAAGAASVEVCTMLFKPDALLWEDQRPKYIGREIPKEFIVGHGLDYDGYGRTLNDIYKIVEN